MKRFFQVVTKDPSFKRARKDSDDGGQDEDPASVSGQGDASQGISEGAARGADAIEDPLSFMSWNANSLLLRLKHNRAEIAEFVRLHDPDVIAIQEVRMPAAGPKAGPKNRAELSDETASAREEKQLIMRALSTPPFASYRSYFSLADGKYSGVALLVKTTLRVLSVAFCWDQLLGGPGGGGKKGRHEQEGRIIGLEFPRMRVLNTYGMNNGWKEEAFERRREWDKKALESLQPLVAEKPLVWCGDMNVSHEDADVSHPEFFRNAKQAGCSPAPDDAGQPGFTPNERKRFSEILQKCDLVDTYRHLHPQKDYEGGFTWSGNPVGKYRGKRMRIDYFLVSRSLLDRVQSSDIHGRGIEMEGFMKSDHCPLTMRLRPLSPATVLSSGAVDEGKATSAEVELKPGRE